MKMLELTCFLYNKKLADLDIKTKDEEARMAINVDHISQVQERMDDNDEIDPNKCIIFMSSGENFLCGQSYDYVLSAIKNFRV